MFDGFLQRKSYFVIPQMDKLKKEKIELKQQMGVMRQGGQQYPKLRVVAAGEDRAQAADGRHAPRWPAVPQAESSRRWRRSSSSSRWASCAKVASSTPS